MSPLTFPTYISRPLCTVLDMFASSPPTLINTPLVNTPFLTLSKMVGSTSKSTVVSMSSPSRASSSTSSSKNSYSSTDTTNAPPLPVFGATNGALFSSASLSTTLVLNMSATATPTTFGVTSNNTMASLKYGRLTCTQASISMGTTSNAPVALPWKNTSPTSASSGITPIPRSVSFPPTSTHPFSMEPKFNILP